jgi:hypothetical protein
MEPAGPARVERRLAAILEADVADYSCLIEVDDEGKLGRLKVFRVGVIDSKIAAHRGRIVKTTGDWLLSSSPTSLSEVPNGKLREYDPEDTIRFYALRLRDVGFIKSSPQKIIADNTDWRFLNEIRRELKA